MGKFVEKKLSLYGYGKNDRKCRWYQNDKEGLKRVSRKVSVTLCCRAGLNFLGVFLANLLLIVNILLTSPTYLFVFYTCHFLDSHGIVFHSGTILEAQAECGTDGIPTGESLSEYYRLIQLMLKENIDKVWLGIRRKLFGPSWVSTRTTGTVLHFFCFVLHKMLFHLKTSG